MSDQEAVPEYFNATLIRGSTYMYKGVTFRRGEPLKVTPATKAYLEENAFEDVMVGEGEDMEVERRPKFDFTVPGAPAKAPRTRNRARS
ncbi:hypothetical protein EVC24_063 [Rhizobium phage RHph_I4]|nr:hypothetical protein EVC24_063 [Rhizobium phage RHph_I4]